MQIKELACLRVGKEAKKHNTRGTECGTQRSQRPHSRGDRKYAEAAENGRDIDAT